LQEKLEADIRKAVNLAVETLATRASAESKQLDNSGLEAGLSYIGLELEHAERLISEYWAAYESIKPEGRQIASVKYPDRYSLKTDADRITEAEKRAKLMNSVPGPTVKREIAKSIVQSLLGGRVAVDTIAKINAEIDSAPYTTSDPNVVVAAVNAGLMCPETGALALGGGPGEAKRAQAAHVERAKAIAAAQGVIRGTGSVPGINDPNDPAARGVEDLSSNLDAGVLEKADSTNPDIQVDAKPKVRGNGRKPNKGYEPDDAAPLTEGATKDLSLRTPFN
jgi:hypothetical protein